MFRPLQYFVRPFFTHFCFPPIWRGRGRLPSRHRLFCFLWGRAPPRKHFAIGTITQFLLYWPDICTFFTPIFPCSACPQKHPLNNTLDSPKTFRPNLPGLPSPGRKLKFSAIPPRRLPPSSALNPTKILKGPWEVVHVISF